MPTNNESAGGRAAAARDRAAAARDRAAAARDRVRVTAIKGAGWKILEFFAQNTPAWGALFYILLSSIGVTYSWAFYSRFEGVHIFDFFDTSDFLLSAFQNVDMLVIGIIAALISIGIPFHRALNSIIYSARDFNKDIQRSQVRREAVFLLLITLGFIIFAFYPWLRWTWTPEWSLASMEKEWGLLGSVVYLTSIGMLGYLCYLAYRFIRIAYTPVIKDDRVRWPEVVLLSIISVGATFILPFLWGKADSLAALEDRARLVRVTIRHDADQSETRLPTQGHTLFLGTTGSFHFFYECENALKDKNGQTTEQECGEGKPFIVPIANLASLAFNLQKGESEVGLSAIATAITELNKTIGALNLNAFFRIESGDVFFDTTKVAKEIATLSKIIESLELRVVSDPALDKVAAAISALQSYLKGNATITNLEEAIITLNTTIKSLEPKQPDDVSNSDPNTTATLKALNETLSKLNTTIAKSFNISGVQNHCVSDSKAVAIGPFPVGEHDGLEEKTARRCSSQEGTESPERGAEECLATTDQLIARMKKRFEDQQTLQHLMLIGRVDTSQLTPDNSQFYGEQRNLARGRAEWVYGKLLREFPMQIDPRRATLLSSNYRKKNEGKERRELDRSVEVWACWAPEPTPKAISTSQASAG